MTLQHLSTSVKVGGEEQFELQSNEPIQVAFVVCSLESITASLAAIKSLVLLSIRPVHLVLLTQGRDYFIHKKISKIPSISMKVKTKFLGTSGAHPEVSWSHFAGF